MIRILIVFALLFCAWSPRSLLGQNADVPDTLVICAPKFRTAIQPWVDYRRRQGHRILVQSPAANSYGIKQQVRRVASIGTLKNVLIVGDARDPHGDQTRLVPTDYVQATVNVKFGSEPDISTDNTYADLDDDGVPNLAIGRLPVDTPEELTRLTRRIIDYEASAHNGEWARRINFVAGVGGFGPLIDKLIEQSAKAIITDLIPPEYQTTMTYGSWTSPYCPDPRRFSQTTIERFNEGCLFWVYIGHGSRQKLDKIYLPDQSHRILDCQCARHLKCRNGSPIAVFLACYTGDTDDQRDCLAEEMIRQPSGPIAVLCGTRVTMPYAMSVMSLEMLREFFDGDTETLGELVRLAKQKMVKNDKSDDDYRTMIENMGKAFSPTPGLLQEEREEHVHLMHLIGDPLLRLRRPQKIRLKPIGQVTAGGVIKVEGRVPSDGNLTLDVCYKRDRFRTRPPHRREYDSSDESFKSYQKAYEDTLKLICVRDDRQVKKGQFSAELKLPAGASGECFVRAMLVSEKCFAMGAVPIEIQAGD